MSAAKQSAPGPFRVDQIRAGDPYELSNGHPVYCAPTGGDGAGANLVGAQVLSTDPAVETAGVDAGYALADGTLRAPDIAIGGVPDQRGWIKGQVPPLAVEYASVGQDEVELQEKIADLLGAGTQFIWVVRLLGERRVEVYQPGKAPFTLRQGAVLSAPGVLKNEVPVEALYDRSVAHELTLKNLLERKGYSSLSAIREEGREEGRAEGREEGRRAERIALIEKLVLGGMSLEAATQMVEKQR
jgi:Uma2 family endonuclease